MEPGPLRQLLPNPIHVVEAVEDLEPEANGNPFADVESEGLQHAVEQRRLEFLTTRCCAHAALEATGVPPEPLLRGTHGQPLWPNGVIGSLTHFSTRAGPGVPATSAAPATPGARAFPAGVYRGAAVTRADRFALLGIDAEQLAPLPAGISAMIFTQSERRSAAVMFGAMPDLPLGRLIFSIKESFYKARYPVAGSWLDFLDAEVAFDRPDLCRPERLPAHVGSVASGFDVAGTFAVRLVNRMRSHRSLPDSLEGRFLVSDGRILTSVLLES